MLRVTLRMRGLTGDEGGKRRKRGKERGGGLDKKETLLEYEKLERGWGDRVLGEGGKRSG